MLTCMTQWVELIRNHSLSDTTILNKLMIGALAQAAGIDVLRYNASSDAPRLGWDVRV